MVPTTLAVTAQLAGVSTLQVRRLVEQGLLKPMAEAPANTFDAVALKMGLGSRSIQLELDADSPQFGVTVFDQEDSLSGLADQVPGNITVDRYPISRVLKSGPDERLLGSRTRGREPYCAVLDMRGGALVDSTHLCRVCTIQGIRPPVLIGLVPQGTLPGGTLPMLFDDVFREPVHFPLLGIRVSQLIARRAARHRLEGHIQKHSVPPAD